MNDEYEINLTKSKYFWPGLIAVIFLITRLPLINAYKALWWDESQYLLMIKHLFLNTPTTGWWEGRSIIHAWLIYIITLPFGYNEGVIKIVNILFCLGFSISTYYLIKELFDNKKAVLSGLIITSLWVILFWSLRINIDMINAWLLTLSALFYLREGKKNKALSGLMLGLALTIRFTGIITGGVYLIHSLINKKKIKDYYWAPATIIGYLPLAIENWVTFSNPLHAVISFITANTQGQLLNDATYYLNTLSHFGTIMGVLVLIGLIPLLFKLKNSKINFITLNVTIYLTFYSLMANLKDLRFTMHLIPFFIIITIIGAEFLLSVKISKKKIIPLLTIITLLICIENLIAGVQSVQRVSESYLDVKMAGEFLKDKEGIIMSQSIPQITYYSEKETYNFPQNETAFLEVIHNYSYIIVSSYESHPEYVYYLNYSFLTPIKAYPDPQNMRLMILKVNQTQKIN